MAVQDEDLLRDDPLARLVLELGSVVPGTQYDCWYPLQRSPFARHTRKLGSIRLRFSISYDSHRERIALYPSHLAPRHVVDFVRGKYRRAAAFGIRTRRPTFVEKKKKMKKARLRVFICD